MIISHKYKYLFVELPNTASTAIRRELCGYYDGTPILRKHAYYHEFLEIAKPDEKSYFVFSCIRHPLDLAVTLYFKYKTNWKEVFTNPKKMGRQVSQPVRRRYEFIQRTDADFSAYFRKFYRFPYDDWSSLSHKEFDFIIRFEHLQDDFAKILSLLGITQQRPLPVVNRTAEKGDDFWSYYTPEIREQAVKKFGPHMRKWGYEFPPEWRAGSVPWSSTMEYQLMSFFRRQLQWGSPFYFRLFKRVADLFGL